MSWRDSAYAVMSKVHMEGVQAGKTPPEIAKAIDAAYPWGERRRWPYKAWLAARKEFFARRGLPMRTTKKLAPDLLSAERMI